MNRKLIAQNPNIIAGAFFVFFLIGLWMTRMQILDSLTYSAQVVLFHTILLANTYFSIQCFGRITPSDDRWQQFFDYVLIVVYAVTPFMLTKPGMYTLLMVFLFLIASMKYVRLIGVISDMKLVKRKIVIDLTGLFWSYCIFFLGSFNVIPLDILLWIWVGVFAISNYYLLRIKPMYCLTSP
jgi:hypothetical protein